MSENKPVAGVADHKRDAMWVRIGEDRWYAIPPNMAESFIKAGAEVRQAHELPQ